jgi:hypothetical protein
MAASHALYQLSYGPLFALPSALMLRCASEHSGHTGETAYLPGRPGTGTPAGRAGGTMQTDRTAPSVAASVGDIRTLADSWRISLHAANLIENTIDTYTDSLD